MIKESELLQKLRNLATAILSSTGFLKIIEGVSNYPDWPQMLNTKLFDFFIQVETKDQKRYWLLFEVKSLGQPRYVREAVERLREYSSYGGKVYCIFGAPSIFEESQEICKKNGIGFIDLAGNCLLNFDNIYISIQGNPKLRTIKRPLKSLFTPASSRGLRALFLDPKRKWLVSDLAKEAGISIGQASNLKQRLLDFEFIQETDIAVKKGKKFKLANQESLLKKWAENYSYSKNVMRSFYSFDDPVAIENKLSDFLGSNNIPYAFTLTSGASFVAPFIRYNRVFIYIKGRAEDVVKALDLKEVPSGANLILLEPYEQGIFYGLQQFQRKGQLHKFKVVSDIQLYLDLKNYKERGEEAADFILTQRLREQWS